MYCNQGFRNSNQRVLSWLDCQEFPCCSLSRMMDASTWKLLVSLPIHHRTELVVALQWLSMFQTPQLFRKERTKIVSTRNVANRNVPQQWMKLLWEKWNSRHFPFAQVWKKPIMEKVHWPQMSFTRVSRCCWANSPWCGSRRQEDLRSYWTSLVIVMGLEFSRHDHLSFLVGAAVVAPFTSSVGVVVHGIVLLEWCFFEANKQLIRVQNWTFGTQVMSPIDG